MRLEWSFITSSNTTTLNVTPHWESKEIGFNYETTFDTPSILVPIEIVIPTGWGWSHFDIQGPTLRSFRSTDVEGWATTIVANRDEEEEESFSTIRNIIPSNLRPSLGRSASLMKQSLPDDIRIDEFSFENQDDSGTHTIVPSSPILERRVIVPDKPTTARLFDLVFDDDEGGRSFMIEGTLAPLFPTLVSGSLPVDIPFVKSGEYQVTCANSTLADTSDTSGSHIGTFTWVDMYGSPIPSSTIPIKGDVRVRLMRDTWGQIRMSLLFPCKKGEVAFSLGNGSLQIRKAEVDGIPIRYCLTEEGLRLGCDGSGMAEVEIDLGEGDVSLPHFEGAEGVMVVELRGPGWEGELALHFRSRKADIQQSRLYQVSHPTPPPLGHGQPHSPLSNPFNSTSTLPRVPNAERLEHYSHSQHSSTSSCSG